MLYWFPGCFRSLIRACVLMSSALAIGAIPAVGEADTDRNPSEAEAAEERPRASYLAIAEAWQAGNPEALADMVHPDGLQVRAGKGGRATSYSPSQSFYYFKNIFRDNITESFAYQRQQRATGPRVHAMAVWRFREAAGDEPRERRLVLVLARSGDTWLLTEINAVR